MSNAWNRHSKFRARAALHVTLLACLISSFSVVGWAQAGQLDPAFANHGIFTTNFSACCGAVTAVALQSNGKILVGGQLRPSSTAALVGAILRLNPDGTVDHTFGNGGMVTTTIGSTGASVGGLAIQTDGKILASVIGAFLPRGNVTRFNPNGSVDTTFGTNGSATAPGVVPTGPLVLQPDGNILMAGGEFSSGLLVRFDTTGHLDTTFGQGGEAVLLVAASGIALLSNGQILVSSGQTGPGPGPAISEFPGVIRYNSIGRVDKTFGSSGRAASVASPSTLIVQIDGAILSAGRIFTGVATPTAFTGNPTGFSLLRFNSTGGVDTTFGSNGGVITTFPTMNFGEILAVALQANGDIVAAGQAGNAPSNGTQFTSSFALARYLSTGQLDSTFGTGGRVTTSFGSTNVAFISGVVIQIDGKIVVAGTTGDAVGNFAVARYLAQ